ncbi:hypothetical protein LOK49_LG01G02375 [Camellia lanceoleosa]|uniref:Uncharacterized protein n=1 Tax=Camellia lanceoleosa TaxID=1840588 RepID=A0ACC0IUM5_9ERIC|nr:hypothetical protein LOK49_LG01G02375 [Camellia lanceoleosa]
MAGLFKPQSQIEEPSDSIQGFGFIRYERSDLAKEAARKFDKPWYGDFKLIVKPARVAEEQIMSIHNPKSVGEFSNDDNNEVSDKGVHLDDVENVHPIREEQRGTGSILGTTISEWRSRMSDQAYSK